MIEKEMNTHQAVALDKLKQEVELRKVTNDKMNTDNEELIDRVAQAEMKIEQKDEEIQLLNKKKLDYKLMIEQLKDKNKHIEEVLSNAEQSKVMEVKQMEQRIESRVAKIVLQKEQQMKQEKQLILGKYQQYEKKIKDQRQQLADAHSLI